LIGFGAGMLIGTLVNVELIERCAADGVCNWKSVFMIIAHASAVLLALMAVLFRDDAKKQDS